MTAGRAKTAFLVLLSLYCVCAFASTAAYQVAHGLIVLFAIWHVFYYRNLGVLKEIFSKNREMVALFCIFTLFLCVSTLLNQEFVSKKSNSHLALFVLRYGAVFAILCYFYRLQYFSKKFLINLMLFSVLIILFGGIYELLFGEFNGSIKGFFSFRNTFGFFCGLGLVFALVFIDKNLAKIAFATLCAIFLALSFQRSAWIAACAGIFLYYAFVKKFSKFDILVICSFCFVGLFLYEFYEPFRERVLDLLSGKSSGRNEIWKFAIEKIKLSPIFGYGLDSFTAVSESKFYYGGLVTRPHNLELHLLFDSGILGFLAYFGMIFYTFYYLFKAKKWPILPILGYYFAIMQFDYTPHMSSKQLSILAMVLFLLFSDKFKPKGEIQ